MEEGRFWGECCGNDAERAARGGAGAKGETFPLPPGGAVSGWATPGCCCCGGYCSLY